MFSPVVSQAYSVTSSFDPSGASAPRNDSKATVRNYLGGGGQSSTSGDHDFYKHRPLKSIQTDYEVDKVLESEHDFYKHRPLQSIQTGYAVKDKGVGESNPPAKLSSQLENMNSEVDKTLECVQEYYTSPPNPYKCNQGTAKDNDIEALETGELTASDSSPWSGRPISDLRRYAQNPEKCQPDYNDESIFFSYNQLELFSKTVDKAEPYHLGDFWGKMEPSLLEHMRPRCENLRNNFFRKFNADVKPMERLVRSVRISGVNFDCFMAALKAAGYQDQLKQFFPSSVSGDASNNSSLGLAAKTEEQRDFKRPSTYVFFKRNAGNSSQSSESSRYNDKKGLNKLFKRLKAPKPENTQGEGAGLTADKVAAPEEKKLIIIERCSSV